MGTSVSLGPLSPEPRRLRIQLLRLPTRLLQTLLVRGAAFWLLSRLVVKAILAAAKSTYAAPVVDDTGLTVLPVWVIVVTATLVFVDIRRRRELSLLHNLGVTTSHAVLAGTAPAAAMETVLYLLVR